MSKRETKLRCLFKKGAVEILLFLDSKGTARYSEIKKQEFVIGDRSLSRLLKELQTYGMIQRETLPTFPVSTQYSLTKKGKRAVKHLKELTKLMTSDSEVNL